MTQLAALKLDRIVSPMGMELVSDASPHFSLFESDSVSTFRDEATDAYEGGGPASTRASLLTRTPLTAQTSSRYSFYSPEMNLIAKTELTSSATPAILHEYVWFNGHPVAQLDGLGAGATVSWTSTDHLGTPIVQTSSLQGVVWQAEYEPYGKVYALRAGDNQHQPLRLPGQEAEELELGMNGSTEKSYNIHRWYRPGWGRYTQGDPAGLAAGTNLFAYVLGNPLAASDSLGLLGSIFGGIQRGFTCAVSIAKSAAAEGRTNGWPWAHCMASCEIRKQCGFATAWNLALLKEFWDVAQCGLELFGGRRPPVGGSCFSAFQAGDFENNAFGRRCPKDNDCSRHCSPLLGQFDRPEDAGPLYDWARHASPGRGLQP